jgi:alkanesulfonate monooxygenase SsuD/methylene tetrahydromethanopterin reductase-like flavin-dependent oxidoreductase (luciferase family)
LNQITGGRMICGLGRGDSAVRVLRRNPANVAATANAVEVIKTLGSGKSMEIDGVHVEMPWASGDLPVCLAAYGPRMFRLAGQIADGVIIENADPYFIRWGLERMREGAKEAGRNPDDLAVIASAPSVVTDDIDAARAEVRSFAALIVNHVAEVQRNAGTQAIPPEWAEFLEAHGEYDYLHHVDRDAPHAQHMPDDIVDRLAVIGTAAECERKLRELAGIGVTHFNLYAQVSDFPTVMHTYSRDIMPALRGSAVTS